MNVGLSMTQSSSQQILARIYGHGRGYVFTPKDFQDAVLVQALKAMGETAASAPGALSPLRETLDAKMLSRALREARYATSWIYAAIKRLAAGKESRHA